jgi:hypothetical protein
LENKKQHILVIEMLKFLVQFFTNLLSHYKLNRRVDTARKAATYSQGKIIRLTIRGRQPCNIYYNILFINS